MKFATTKAFVLSLFCISGYAQAEDSDLLKRLGEAKLSLGQGIAQIAYEHGPAISGKFEIKKGILKLSVYTVRDGLKIGAEKNPLLELIGDATGSA